MLDERFQNIKIALKNVNIPMWVPKRVKNLQFVECFEEKGTLSAFYIQIFKINKSDAMLLYYFLMSEGGLASSVCWNMSKMLYPGLYIICSTADPLAIIELNYDENRNWDFSEGFSS